MKSIKSKKVKVINEKTMIAALDIGKTVHYAYFRAPDGKDIKPFSFYNFKKSFDKFWMKICQFKAKHGLDEVLVGFESTGPYAEPLCHYLRKKPVKLVQVNPIHSKRLKGSRPHTFPIVKTLPPGDAPIGTVINGTRDGPRFDLPEGSFSDLQNVGIFGPPRCGKTYLMKSIALDTMRRGNAAWIFDVEDEFSDLVEAVDEPYKPITITPEHLRINFFQPPGEGITVKRWRENVASILRSEMFIRDGAQNLFNKTLNVLLKKKGIFAGNNQFPSLVEVLCALKVLKLPYSSSRCNSCLESLFNRTERLVDTYEETAHVTNSDMLPLLASKSVIFRFHNIRGITLFFLLNFLLMWLACYRQSVTATAKVQTLFMDGQYFLREAKFRNDIGDNAVQAIASTGAKRGLRLVLANQLISELDSKILGNLACKIITRLTSPADIGIIQKSMGLSPD